MSKKGKVIVISGPSGVGKGTINDALLLQKDLKLIPSISMTTRKPREGEIDGVNYFFVSKETFNEHIKNDDFIEYAEFIGNYYGTLKSKVYEHTNRGENIVLEIEAIGANKVIKSVPKKELVSLFLVPPSLKHLEERLRGRGTESEEIIKKRLDKALVEIALKYNYKYAVILDTTENTIKKIRDILLAEDCLDDDPNNSLYFKTRNIVANIIKEKYQYFVDNWEVNVNAIGNSLPKNINLFEMLVSLLSDRIYRFVLANKEFNLLDNFDFISKYTEKFILDINFFTIDQENFMKNYDS